MLSGDRFDALGVVAAAVLLTTSGCGVVRMLPKDRVVDRHERRRVWGEVRPSGANYTGESAVDHPVVPFLVFGVPYDLDIVLVSKHPDWEMHEYARVRTPDGPIWLAKDTRASDGDQLLVTGSAPLLRQMPEIPLAAKRRPVRVVNRSEGNRLDLRIRYRNYVGQSVRLRYRGMKPVPIRPRNGSTMGHSRHQALAVLDLPHRSFGDRASISIGGRKYGIRRVFGVQPLRLAIRQTQGGVAEASYRYSGEGGRTTCHARTGRSSSNLRWEIDRRERRLVLRQRADLRTLVYRFRRGASGALELYEVAVEFWNAEEPVYRMRFAPALPDPRRPFDGVVRSRWVADVGGQKGHAAGEVRVRRRVGRASIDLRGTEPWWVADRCVDSSIRLETGDGVAVTTEVEPCGG